MRLGFLPPPASFRWLLLARFPTCVCCLFGSKVRRVFQGILGLAAKRSANEVMRSCLEEKRSPKILRDPSHTGGGRKTLRGVIALKHVGPPRQGTEFLKPTK